MDLLRRASPQPGYARLFRDVMRDAWRMRRPEADHAHQALGRRVADLEGKRTRLVDVYLEGVVSDDAHRQKRAEVEAEIAEARWHLHDAESA